MAGGWWQTGRSGRPVLHSRSVSGRPAVLVVRFGALGDVVLTTPLLRALHRAHPGAHVTVVTKAAWGPLFTSHPHVAAVEALAPDEPLRDLARRLRATAWDYRLDLHGSLRSRLLRRLVGGRWSGWRKPRIRRALRLWTRGRFGPAPLPVAEQYFAAAHDLGIAPDGGPPDVHPGPEDDARARAAAPEARFVALAPGASRATKRWPPTHWERLARLLGDAGVPVVTVGTAGERGLLPSGRDACGIGLGPTAALLRRAAAVVAHDSGLMHLATAVGTPVVALFGPTVPELGYGPYHADAVVLGRDLACRPCSVYGSAHCPLRHHRCMIDLMPETVADAVRERLA
jgi:heptosyltransferase II